MGKIIFPKIEKAKPNILRALWQWFSSLDFFTKEVIFFVIGFSAITPFIISNRFDTLQRANEDHSNALGVGNYFTGYAQYMRDNSSKSDQQIEAEITEQYTAFHDLGAIWAREEIPWEFIEQEKGAFDWKSVDLGLNVYHFPQDKIVALLDKTPSWASSAPAGTPKGDKNKYPPQDLNDWRNFVSQVVTRYKDRVKYWEILNEADTDGFFLPKPGQTREQSYLEMLKIASETIHQLDPQARILSNAFDAGNFSLDGISGTGDKMITYIMENNGPYFDILNIHVYGAEPDTRVQRAKQVLGRYPQMSNTEIWVTETNVHDYLRSLGSQVSVANASHVMESWLRTQLDAGAQRVFWFRLTNHQCDEGCPQFEVPGLTKTEINNFERQETWYKMQELIQPIQISPTSIPTPQPTNTPTPTNTPIPTPTIRPTNTPVPTGTPTPIPPTPTNTPTPIPTATPTPLPHPADINRNGCVDIADFQIWSRAFIGLPIPPTASPDVNSDGRINILDFNVWYKAVRDMAQPCG